MGRNKTGRRQDLAADTQGVAPASPETVKVTLHLTVGTAQRLGVESAMRRISQSAIAEEVLAAYLSRWQLPSVADSNNSRPAEVADTSSLPNGAPPRGKD